MPTVPSDPAPEIEAPDPEPPAPEPHPKEVAGRMRKARIMADLIWDAGLRIANLEVGNTGEEFWRILCAEARFDPKYSPSQLTREQVFELLRERECQQAK